MGAETTIPSVRVYVFTHNHGSYIQEALQSIMNQVCDYPVKITVHDDCSNDETQQVVRETLKNSKFEWELIVPQVNQYKQGKDFFFKVLSQGTEKYIAILDGDDYWTDTSKLQRQVETLEKNPDSSLCHHTFSTGGPNTAQESWPSPNWRSTQPGHSLSEENFIGTLTVMFRRSALPISMGPLFNDLPVMDYPLWGVISDGSQITFVDKNMATYRIHEENNWAHTTPIQKKMTELSSKIFIASRVQKQNIRFWRESLFSDLISLFQSK